MNRLKFYFTQSLIGYFCRRAREKWFPPALPAQIDLHGIKLQLDAVPKNMQLILMSGHYEAPELKILPNLLTSEDEVLEIGAAMGVLGLFCRKNIKVKNLASVEPNPKTLTYLRRNYELNGLTPNVIEAALCDKDGPVTFYFNDYFWADSLILHDKAGPSKPMQVEGLSFATIAKRAGFEFNTLIIDVEGAEQYLPCSAIPAHVKKVLIEIHPDMIGNRPAFGVLEALILAGFRIQESCCNCWGLVRE